MPYGSITDLPAAVRARYSERCQEVFRKAVNNALASTKGGGAADEGKAMAAGHTAAQMCASAGKAQWDTAYINDLPDSAFLYIEAGGEKDDEGKTTPRSLRHFPYRDADGQIDLPHLRNAASRIPQADLPQGIKDRLAAKVADLLDQYGNSGKAQLPLKATVIDDDAFRLLAIPFGGPIPSPIWPRGVDLDGETFTERTDIKADWFDVRLVDWHHGQDDVMRRTIIGKAGNLTMEDDGWWVDVWLRHGERRLDLIRQLAERGGQLFGSSEPLPKAVVRSPQGEILVWPYIRQTLSTSPQNTFSVLRPMKAVLDGVEPTVSFWQDIEVALRDLGTDLRSTSLAEGANAAKAGRVLSQQNENDLREALGQLEAALSRANAVLSRQTPKQESSTPA